MVAVLMISAACFFWALDTLIRYPLLQEGVPASSIVFFEHVILCLLCVPYLGHFLKKVTLKKPDDLFSLAFIGILGSSVATFCFTRAFEFMNPSVVIILQKLQPVVAIIFARIILKEKISRLFYFCAVLSILGTLLISYQDIRNILHLKESGHTVSMKFFTGLLFTLSAVFGWGLSTVLGKRLSINGYNPKEIMVGRFLFGLAGSIPLYVMNSHRADSLTLTFFGKIGVMVVLSGILGIYLYYQGLQKLPATISTLAELMFPLAAVVVNWIFLNLSLEPQEILGCILILISPQILVNQKYLKKRFLERNREQLT